MAVGTFVVLNAAKEDIADSTFDLDNDSFRWVLLTNSVTPAATNTVWSNWSANEVTGTGYTANGIAATLTVSESSGTVTVDASEPSWTGSTITAKYAGLVRDANADGDLAAGDLLLGYCDLDTGGGTVSTTNDTFSVTTPSGLFTLS